MNVMSNRYQLKAVIFDIQSECRELKQRLVSAEIAVIVPFFGLKTENTLKKLFTDSFFSPTDCLLLTNNELHVKDAEDMGIAVVGCVEGHFAVPKKVTLLEEPEEVSVLYLNQVYCHQKNIPAIIAETERCYIREMTAENADSLYEILTEEETLKYLSEKVGPKEEEIAKILSYVSQVYSFFGYGYWGVFLKENDELIGRAGFREGEFPLEVGYVIKCSYRRQGYATEVLSALIHYAEEELGTTKIYANIDARNTASLRLAEKCGIECKKLGA